LNCWSSMKWRKCEKLTLVAMPEWVPIQYIWHAIFLRVQMTCRIPLKFTFIILFLVKFLTIYLQKKYNLYVIRYFTHLQIIMVFFSRTRRRAAYLCIKGECKSFCYNLTPATFICFHSHRLIYNCSLYIAFGICKLLVLIMHAPWSFTSVHFPQNNLER